MQPADALRAQPGDYALALRHATESSVVESDTEAAEVVMDVALPIAVRIVNRADVWAAIERVAAAVLDAGGQLVSPSREDRIAHTIPEASADRRPPIGF